MMPSLDPEVLTAIDELPLKLTGHYMIITRIRFWLSVTQAEG